MTGAADLASTDRVSDIPAAASVILARGPASPELFLVRRADELRFFGGFHAFPGGRVDLADDELARQIPGLTRMHVAATRELFEETGVLLARDSSGAFPREDLTSARRALLARESSFGELLRSQQWTILATDLNPIGSLVTPAFAPQRFDTRFFVAETPAGQSAEVWPGELATGEWLTAEAALGDWEAERRLLSPPTVSLLDAIRGQAVQQLPARMKPLLDLLAMGEPPPIPFAAWVEMIPLRTAGLPPSTHTNAYLVGHDPAYLLDPGPTDPGEQARLFCVLDRLQARGRRLSAIVLTHHHPDHIGAANAVAARYEVPILAHALTASLLSGKVTVTRTLSEGESLALGTAPGENERRLESVHTPGHAPGHLAFFERHSRYLFAGDMLSTLSSVAIVPPEGNLTEYLASLRRLQALPSRLLLPAHGAPTARPAFALQQCLEHRLQRERQLLEALATESRTIADLASVLYRGLPSALMKLAEAQTIAGLLKLQEEGRVRQTGENWQRI